MVHDHAGHDRIRPGGHTSPTGHASADDGDGAARSDTLRARGLRVTASRLAVLELLDRSDEPLTHHDVVQHFQKSPWNRSTLYRNLIDLTEVGLLVKSEIGGLARFERAGRMNACAEHPHFVCTDCGVVSHLESVSVHFEGRGPAAVMTGHVAVQLRGRCDECD